MNWKTTLVLALVGFFAILIRLYPTMHNFAFGNDFGIYNTIAGDFLRSGKIFDTFTSPWGGAGYGDFPVMYWIVDGLAKATGINYTTMLVKAPPVFGGLDAITIYFIAYKLTKSRFISIFAAIFDAVNPVIVFQTSISSILVFGHFFGLLAVLFYIMYLENRRFFIPFLASSVLLVMSHPLSTFMYLTAVIGITISYLAKGADLSKRLQLAAGVYSFSTFVFVYWALFFNSFTGFMSSGVMHIPALAVIALYYVFVSFILFFPLSRIRIHMPALKQEIFRKRISWLYLALIIYSLISAFSLVLLFSLLKTISLKDVVAFLPLLLDGALALVGMYFARGYFKQIISGWVFILGAALIYSVATWNMVLYPGRFMEYIFEPLSILEALGIVNILYGLRDYYEKEIDKIHNTYANTGVYTAPIIRERREINYKNIILDPVRKTLNTRSSKINASLAVFLLVFLVASSAATPYQVGSIVTPSGNQTISLPDFEAAKWLQYNGDTNYSVATDHILGLMVDSYNLTGTFEQINHTWSQSTLTNQTVHELLGNSYSSAYNYTPVGYIFIDNYMFTNGVWGYKGLSNPYSEPIKMTNQSFLKFLSTPFVPVYFNNTSKSTWALVVQVNWTYIDANYGTSVSTTNYTMMPQYVPDSQIVNATLKNLKRS